MTELFKFQREEECCEECEAEFTLINEFIQFALNSDSEEELAEIMVDLFLTGKEIGYQQSLEHSIKADTRLLQELRGCEDCDCEDGCELES